MNQNEPQVPNVQQSETDLATAERNSFLLFLLTKLNATVYNKVSSFEDVRSLLTLKLNQNGIRKLVWFWLQCLEDRM